MAVGPTDPARGAGGDGDGDAGELTAYLSLLEHELRTPLTVTISAVDSLVAALEQPELDRDMVVQLGDVIQRHSRLAERMLGRLGRARDIERGTVELEADEVDLASLVEDAVTDMAGFVLSARKVSVSTDEAVPAILDPAAVAEIVFNLLNNAAKYSADDAPIEVSVRRVDGQGQVVVRDHGDGVEAGDVAHIFGRFVQGDARTLGVGLGLYVSRGLARAMGGDLRVRSAKDAGSEFVLELPVSRI